MLWQIVVTPDIQTQRKASIMIGNMFQKSAALKKASSENFLRSAATAGILLALASGLTACGGGEAEESSAVGRVTPQMMFAETPPEEAVTGTAKCTYTQGYWKTHGPTAKGKNSNVWPFYNASSMRLGNYNYYTASQLQQIFETQPATNGIYALAHQLIAAKLNVANGADATAINASIVAAQALIGDLRLLPLNEAGYLMPSVTSPLVNTLTAYNEGRIGPGHCG